MSIKHRDREEPSIASPATTVAGRAGGIGGAARHRAGKADRPPWFTTHGRDLLFLLVFGVLIGLYYGVTTLAVAREGFFPWYLRLNARASAAILNVIGYDEVSANGQAVQSPRFSIQIERGCDAIEPSALFVAAVLASPVRFRRKIPAVLIGSAFLLLLNLVRIVTLYLTGLHFKRLFDTMHLDVWQAAFIVLAILFWAGWASWVRRTPARKPDVTA